jgi:hypothetical protein
MHQYPFALDVDIEVQLNVLFSDGGWRDVQPFEGDE